MKEKIAVIGLGYVGLPLAIALAKKYDHVLGFDISAPRVKDLQSNIDKTHEVETEDLEKTTMTFSADMESLHGHNFYIVTVPTPIDKHKQPDLTAVKSATKMLAKYIEKGSVIVYESTVYPGVTEEICGPILAEHSDLTPGVDFKLGYSPERINPGDKEHTIDRIVKVVSGEDEESLERVSAVYGSIITAGIHKAPSIKVAEAAKVIENVQRDLNIALMNELALIFNKLDIRTKDVLKAAGTKWNFLPFVPGLVGGHCIGVDPYYLTTKAEMVGYHPEVILAGRRINDSMSQFVAKETIKKMIDSDIPIKGSRVGVLGLTFKENVPDLRNSRVPDIITELKDFGVEPFIHDPFVDPEEAHEEYGLSLTTWDELHDLDALILAVSHKQFMERSIEVLCQKLKKGGVFIDVKSAFHPDQFTEYTYWSL